MRFIKRVSFLAIVLTLLLLFSSNWIMARNNNFNHSILFPNLTLKDKNPTQIYKEATHDKSLILLKAAIFDPLRDGEPDLGEYISNYLKNTPFGKGYYIVQFKSKITPGLEKQIEKEGGKIIEYIPNNALLVRLNTTTASLFLKNSNVRWLGDYQPGYKLSPDIATSLKNGLKSDTKFKEIAIQFFPGEDFAGVLDKIASNFASDKYFNYERTGKNSVIYKISTSNVKSFITWVANINSTKWIEYKPKDVLMNDNSIWACQSGDINTKATPIFDHGIIGQGQVVAVADSGLDKDMCFFINQANGNVIDSQTIDPPNPLTTNTAQRKLIAYNILAGADDGDQANHEYHGTHVCGSVAGDNYANLATPTNPGHDTGDGMAPLAKLIMEDGGALGSNNLYFPYPFYDLWAQEAASGANIASNSWGAKSNSYNLGAQMTDQFIWNNEDFSIFVAAGNDGPSAMSLNYLATAKNIISVAATSNGSSGANVIALFSSKGPTDDGRLKPDLAAPGYHILSAKGDSNTQYNCETWLMDGTSMACPTAAGLAALAREYFTDGFYPTGQKNSADVFTPSAALLKAVLVNSCTNLTGGNTGQVGKEDAPAVGQGWGRITLDNTLYFSDETNGRKLIVWDVPNAEGVSTGGVKEYPIHVGSTQPLKITLAWTDPPGSPAAAVALVDDIDLEIVGPDGTIYKGNQWNDQTTGDMKESQPNPTGTDTLNNVEGILIKSPTEGDYIIKVKGINIPGMSPVFSQGYGLVITGDVSKRALPTINIKSITVDDSTGNDDGVIDPGENINLSIELENTGTGSAGDVNATLSTTTDGITITSNTSSYGTLNGSSTATNNTAFTFTVDNSVPTSTTINFSLEIQSSSGGSFTRTFNLKVKPSTPPTLSNFQISEFGVYTYQGTQYPSYVDINIQFDYADPDQDLDKMILFFKVNGHDVNILPVPIDASGLIDASGTGYLSQFHVWAYVATNVGESLQLFGYLTDKQGNQSSVVYSNEITFTKGTTPDDTSGLDDDDSVYVPFADGFWFPFYGNVYNGCWINSDGNITFEAGYEYQSRNPTSFLTEMPRIAPLFTDLAKSVGDGKITVDATSDHFTVNWNDLQQWASMGPVGTHTFSLTLHPDGSIDFTWGECTMSQSQEDDNNVKWKGVVGICPGAVNSDYPSTDLSTLSSPVTIPTSAPIYQGFGEKDDFDLSNTSMTFVPQSTFSPSEVYYFPRLYYKPGEFTEGYGLINPNDTTSNVRFVAYDSDGNIISISSIYPWESMHQAAYQADGIFGFSSETTGWTEVQVDHTDTDSLGGFFLTQYFNNGRLAGLDGAGIFYDTVTEGIIPRVKTTNNYTTTLFIDNPSDSDVQVTLTGYDGTTSYDGGTHSIPSKGSIQLDVQATFGIAFDGYVKLSSTGGIIANALIKHSNDAIASSNLISISDASTTLYAAHITMIPNTYYTEINLINTTGNDTTVTLEPFKADGTAMASPFQVTIPANQVVTLKNTELGLPDGQVSDGWLKVESSSSPILGCLTFGNPIDNHYESTLPLQAEGSDDLGFPQVANGNAGGVNFFTGIAVVNPGDTSADVTIKILSSDGTVLGQVTKTLAPHEKYVRVIDQIEGMGTLPTISSGAIHIIATQPVLSFELFGNTVLDFLSAVPGL